MFCVFIAFAEIALEKMGKKKKEQQSLRRNTERNAVNVHCAMRTDRQVPSVFGGAHPVPERYSHCSK